MAVAVWFLISLPLLLASFLIVAGIELNRRSYEERSALAAHTAPDGVSRPVAGEGGPRAVQTRRAA